MIPIKIKESWNRVNNRISEFCENDYDHSFRMVFITDVHIGAENANHINQLKYLSELLKINPVDFVVNGGDIGLDVGEDDDEARKVIELTKQFTNFNVPYLLIKGNHDFSKNIIDDVTFNEELNHYFLNSNDCDKELINNNNDGGDYGYFIDRKTDTRFIFLNTSEEYRKYILNEKQLNYLIKQLENAKEKNIILLSHFCINKIGNWNRYPNEDNKYTLCFKKLINDFVNKRAGNYEDFSWNFQQTKSTILIHLAGDAHFNNSTRNDGFLVACRQGYGGILPIDIPDNGSVDKFDSNELCNFDILVINKHNKAKLFRVGAGEKTRDLDIN